MGVEATGSIVKTLADFGVDYVDAPVSGGRAGAIRGTVTVMWSGSAERMELIRPVLDSFAGSVFFVGQTPGQGQAMKLLNNYLSAVAMTATSEAVAFGISHSLDMKTMLDVANVSTGQNSATQDKFPNRILTSTYDAGFRMALMEKDVALYLSEAKSAGTAVALCERVATYWQKGMEQFSRRRFYRDIQSHPRRDRLRRRLGIFLKKLKLGAWAGTDVLIPASRICSSLRETQFSPGRKIDEYQEVDIGDRKLIACSIKFVRNYLIDLFQKTLYSQFSPISKL